jgi:hypothetical protein
MKKTIIALLATSAMTGCVHRIGDFTVASTKNMDVKDHTYKIYSGKRVIGEDKAHIILLFPTGVPNMKEAMDKAIESSPGAVGLSDVVVKQGSFYIPLIYGQVWYEIEGTPIVEVSK